jgi:DNA polymerase
MAAKRSAAEFLPERMNMSARRRAAAHCEGCDFYKNATQTVFGEGRRSAEIMLVGEMPGDQEDLQGRPFVGPAGRLLEGALEVAVDRGEVYVTNAVKHFRWEERGKRRLHKKPGWREIEACKPWLQAEVLLVQPKLLICLGATAAQATIGRDFRISKQRGELIEGPPAQWLMATHHPSAMLRAADPEDRRAKRGELVDDLRRAVSYL